MVNTIRLAGIIPESFTDGVGIRLVIFTQGCNHHCKNCHNPSTWDFNGGKLVNIESILNLISQNPLLDGVTLSGGDPFYQVDACLELCKLIKDKTNLNIWCYTGFTWESLLVDSDKSKLLNYIDVLVDGQYVESMRDLTLRFRGSSNQRIIDVNKSLLSDEVVLFMV